LYGGDERIWETVDLPVAMLPVRPRSNMFVVVYFTSLRVFHSVLCLVHTGSSMLAE
jgi:hypothetical protein